MTKMLRFENLSKGKSMSGLVVKLENGEQVQYGVFIHLASRLEGLEEHDRSIIDYLLKKAINANHPLENKKTEFLLRTFQLINGNGNLKEDVAKIVANLKEEKGCFKVSIHSISSVSIYEAINQHRTLTVE